jgi:hypothetical protein
LVVGVDHVGVLFGYWAMEWLVVSEGVDGVNVRNARGDIGLLWPLVEGGGFSGGWLLLDGLLISEAASTREVLAALVLAGSLRNALVNDGGASDTALTSSGAGGACSRYSSAVDVVWVGTATLHLALVTPTVGSEGPILDFCERGDFGGDFACCLPHAQGWVGVHEGLAQGGSARPRGRGGVDCSARIAG